MTTSGEPPLIPERREWRKRWREVPCAIDTGTARRQRARREVMYLLGMEVTEDGDVVECEVVNHRSESERDLAQMSHNTVGVCKSGFTCTCQDFKFRTAFCKHCYFVLERICESESSEQALERLVARVARPSFTSERQKLPLGKGNPRDATCAICFEVFDAEYGGVWTCSECRNGLHDECRSLWAARRRAQNACWSCPSCRAQDDS